MKTLSILLLLASTSALVLGALFAVTPVSADVGPTIATEQKASRDQNESSKPVTLNTGLSSSQKNSADTSTVEASKADTSEATLSLQSANNDQPASADANPDSLTTTSFSSNVQKDASTETSIQASEAQQTNQNVNITELATTLEGFAESVNNGKGRQLRGLFVDDTLALTINQQPDGDPEFITENVGQITQFAMASNYGSLGLIAHNYLAGDEFFKLSDGQILTLVYGDGHMESFRVEQIRSFQALSPGSAYSEFIDLDNGGSLSASDLFHSIYNSDNPLVLQTCINQDGISTWGRIFIIAVPIANG